MQERLKALPGVESTGYSIIRILDGNEWDSSVTVQGYERAEGENMNPHFNAVSPDYFQTLASSFWPAETSIETMSSARRRSRS